MNKTTTSQIVEISNNEDAIKVLTEISNYVNTKFNNKIILSGCWCCPKNETRNLLRCGIAQGDDERFVWYCSNNEFQIMMICDLTRCKSIFFPDGTIIFELFDCSNYNEPVYRVEIL